MKTSLSLSSILEAFLLILMPVSICATGNGGRISTPLGGSPLQTRLNCNNISTLFANNGFSDIDASLNAAFVFPKGTGKTAVYASGFLWGGRVGGKLYVGGSAYRTGLQPGKIISNGLAEDTALAKNRIYRVRPDYATASLTSEVGDGEGSVNAIRNQYQKDWNEWPAADGAPFVDINHNGVYDPLVDIPGVKGASQTIWYVCNDLNPGLTTYLYGTSPMGMELQITIWGYSSNVGLGNTLFRKHLLINKSASTYLDMYISQWSDVDLGYAADDFAGCDTTLSLGYCYNSQAVDSIYAPLPPPAVGFDFLQGPVVPSPGHTAIFKGKKINGFANLPMTAFYYFAAGAPSVTDPKLGDSVGARQFYNFFQGKVGTTGNLFVNPVTGRTTPFALSGDPQLGTGWLDGQLLPPGDRRIGMGSGPFTMAPGDTQEVVVAEIGAGAFLGLDRLGAIGLLKNYDQSIQSAYDSLSILSVASPVEVLKEFRLFSNYPNPFNPLTHLRFTIANFPPKADVPSAQPFVQLKVYDVLGRDVALLVNERTPAGTYEVSWDATNFPSGVYFYQLRAGSFVETKKMILMK